MPPVRRSLPSAHSVASRPGQAPTSTSCGDTKNTRSVVLNVEGGRLESCLRAWATCSVQRLALVEEVEVYGGYPSFSRRSSTVTLSCVRAILEMMPNCMRMVFRRVSICSTNHQRLFPGVVGRLTSLHIVNCVVVTDGLDAATVLAECPRLRDVVLSNVIWIDSRTRYSLPVPTVCLPVRSLGFFVVDEVSTWRVGRVIYAAASVLERLHVALSPSMVSQGKFAFDLYRKLWY